MSALVSGSVEYLEELLQVDSDWRFFLPDKHDSSYQRLCSTLYETNTTSLGVRFRIAKLLQQVDKVRKILRLLQS